MQKSIRSNSNVISACRVIALCVGLLFTLGCKQTLSAQNNLVLNSIITRQVVDSLVNQINKFYVLKEAATTITSFLNKRYTEGFYNRIEDPYVLAGAITEDIQKAYRDEHFHIEYNPVLANEVSGNIDDVPKMVAQKLEEEKARNYGFRKTEILPGNIGYLEISSFSRLNKYSKAAADAAFKMLGNTRAIIIDLRYGRGGSPDMVNYIASRFFKTKTHLADIYIRSENSTLPYWTVSDTSWRILNSMPLFILTSYRTFSAAEGLAFGLQNLKRALIVGETTRGGAHTVTYKPLSNGFVCDIPFGRVLDPITKRNWEGKGIEPDIKTGAEDALEVAELKILARAMAEAKDSVSLNNLLWETKLMRSVNHPHTADSTLLKQYCGKYNFNTVSFEKGSLYFQKTGMARFAMLAVSNNLFRPKDNNSFMIEFKGESPKKSTLIIINDDGRREINEKTAAP